MFAHWSRFASLALLIALVGLAGCGLGGDSPRPPTPAYQKVAASMRIDGLAVNLDRPDGTRFEQPLAAELWFKGAAPRGERCLNVTVHGAGEGRWVYSMAAPADWALADYAYVNYITDVCDVLVFDMPGVGKSPAMPQDKDGLTMTAAAAGSLIRQLVEIFTKGLGPAAGLTYSGKVFLTGHSVGSIDVLAGYPYDGKVAGLVITGLVLTPHPLGNGLALNDFLGYATTPFPVYSDEFWAKMAYYSPGLVPLKGKYGTHEMTLAQLQAGIQTAMNPASLMTSRIKTDVLLVSGGEDAVYPGGFLENDAATFYGSASTEITVPTDTGHATFMHKSAPTTLLAIREWIKKRN